MHLATRDVRGKSPLATAILISLGIAAVAVLSTLDAPVFDEITSGRWLTRSLSQAQARNTAAIAKLERDVRSAASDTDFIAARLAAAVDRNEAATLARLAELDARLAAMKEQIVTQANQTLPAQPVASGEVVGLRKSLHELATAHTGSVAEINKRLNRIERMVGISTDMVSSADHARRRLLKKTAPVAAIVTPQQIGHIFDMRPGTEQTASLRLSKLRD
jgi:ABC-type transporter Mla subunit MlaD